MAKLKATRVQLTTPSKRRLTAIVTASAIATLVAQASYGDQPIPRVTVRPPQVELHTPNLQEHPIEVDNEAVYKSGLSNNNLNNLDTSLPQFTNVTQYGNVTTEGQAPGNTQANGSTNNGGKQAANTKKIGNERCDASDALHENCKETYDWIDNAKLTDTLTQAAGGAVVGATSQVGAMRAQNAGTQTAVMEAAANSQEKAGMLQTALGIGNTAMGAYQIMLSREHKQIGEKKLTTELNNLPANAVAGATPNSNPAVLQQAIKEQKMVEKAAMMAGVKSVISGVTQTLSGALAIGAAKQAKDMAGKLSDVNGSSYQLTSVNPDTGTLNPTTTTAINPGTNSDPAVATDDGNIKANDVPSITPPINPDSVAGGPGAGPVAGSFQSGNAKGAGGGGGSPNLGVGSMSPAKAEPEQTGARMAESRSNTAYSQGGGSGYAAAGGVSAEKSADLGFLANLLPKPQEEMGKNGILDYGNAGRSPASMAPYSFLGKDVNIFQRISDRTTAKLKNGDVGG